MPVLEILKRCQSLPQGHYLVFHSYQVDEEAREYCGSLDIEEAKHPQTILAYEMNETRCLSMTDPHCGYGWKPSSL